MIQQKQITALIDMLFEERISPKVFFKTLVGLASERGTTLPEKEQIMKHIPISYCREQLLEDLLTDDVLCDKAFDLVQEIDRSHVPNVGRGYA